MTGLEQTLDSREVAEMVEKDHNKLLRDIRRYVAQLGEAKIGHSDFFRESTYKSEQNKEIPCYRITKKGCEFIAHKLTGTKGTIFTARYINRFHEMEDILKGQQEPQMPWFIRNFDGYYVVLDRDVEEMIGIGLNDFIKRKDVEFIGGVDFNCNGWYRDNEKFREKYGFDFGDKATLDFFYMAGVRKIIRTVEFDKQYNKKKIKMLKNEGLEELKKGVKCFERKMIANRDKKKKQIVCRQVDEPVTVYINANIMGKIGSKL